MTILTLESENKLFQAEIDPSMGAVLTKFIINGQNVIQYPLKEDDPKKGYPSAFLFPYPNRIKDGKYSFEGNEYKLELNEIQNHNAIHGFVAFQPFEIIESSLSAATLNYTYTGHHNGYPFPFELIIRYQLSNVGLEISVEAKNTGQSNMPIGFAWHPYFGFNGVSVSDMSIKIPKSFKINLDERNIPDGTETAEKGGLIALKNQFLDNLFRADINGEFATIELKLNENVLKLTHNTAQDQLPYFIVYTPPSRNCIAIEPQSASTDAFNNGNGLFILEKGATKKYKIELTGYMA